MPYSPAPSPSLHGRGARNLPGLGVSVGLAVISTVIGGVVPLVGSAVPGIVLGVLLGIVRKPGPRLTPGITFASKFVLQLSVVILGLQLSIGEVARVGLESLPVMLGTLVVCLGAAWLFGRLLGVIGDVRTLIGVGTGICGASAVAAVAPVIGAVSADVAYAVSTIFLFNVAAVIVFPVVGHALGMSQHAFGLFAGTAVNDTSSVVAAASTYGSEAANDAVVVKLVRTLMIIPISIGLAALVARTGPTRQPAATDEQSVAGPAPARMTPRRALRLVPWFLVGFVTMALINSTGLIPTAAHPALSALSTFLIAVALSAIGLSTDIRALRRAGARPLLLGALLWITVSVTSVALQWVTGTL
ncbi:putative sulfate exporter family transporter [Microbacterium sp. NPDC078814]|uniref:YeiH family protein n=1 Tax=Microbacterium sp. NPDC078814 TaxID=3154767 RepID=UPI00344E2A98